MDLNNQDNQGEYQYKIEDLLSTKKEDRKRRREEKRRVKHYKFSDKKHPAAAYVSCGFALVSIGLFVWAVVIATRAAGTAGREIGIIGLFTLISAAVGVVMGLIAFGKTDIKTGFAWAGLISSLLICVVLICIMLIEIDFS